MIGIYRIWNRYSNKSYIGQSIDIEKRISQHYHNKPKKADDWHNELYRHPERFNWEVLETCTKKELSTKEYEYAFKYNAFDNGYNKQNIVKSRKYHTK